MISLLSDYITWLVIQGDDEALVIASSSPKIVEKLISIYLTYQQKGGALVGFGDTSLR